MLLVGCKSDLRTDVSTLVELSNHRQTPVSYDQVSATSHPSGGKINPVCVPGALTVARFSLPVTPVQAEIQVCISGVGGVGFENWSGLKEMG